MANKPVEISVVVPVYNEEGSVVKLHQEIVAALKPLKKTWEIIFVNDGSSDRTFDKLSQLNPIRIINLRKNSGQSVALDAGIKNCRGQVVVTLDGDGQNDPADIPLLLEKLTGEVDAVCGWRFKRQDPASKRIISRGAAALRKVLVDDGVHDAGCTLRACRRECYEDMDLYGEMHRMIPAMLKWKGWKIEEIKVNHRPRVAGVTKYNWKRTVKGLLDMVNVWFWRKYELRPQHLFGGLGLGLIFVSGVALCLLAVLRLFWGYQLSDKIWPLVAMVTFLAGVQLLVSGILAGMILKGDHQKQLYLIKDVRVNE